MHCCKIILNRVKNIEEHPCHRILPVKFDTDELTIKIISCSMIEKGTGYSIIRIFENGNSPVPEGHFECGIGECSITKCGSKQYLAMVINKKCILASLINESGCFLTSATPKTDTLIEWTLVGPSSKKLHTLLNSMKDAGYSFELQSSENMSVKASLTPKQEKCFNTAWDLGYYDVPKRTDLDEMCKIMDCSKSTLNVTLRTAEKKIFELYRMTSRLGDIQKK